MQKETPTRVLYLDLDGTVRHGFDELGRFVNTVSDVHVFPEVIHILRKYKEAGWRIVACSNQGGVALGHMSEIELLRTVMETNKQLGGLLIKVLVCQHHPDAKDPEMAVCWCRKPKSGLVIEVAHALKDMFPLEYYPPHMALFVGDRPEDEKCAQGAGVPFQWAAEWRKNPSGLESE